MRPRKIARRNGGERKLGGFIPTNVVIVPVIPLADRSRDELRIIAAERKIAGRGRMTKAQLVEALS